MYFCINLLKCNHCIFHRSTSIKRLDTTNDFPERRRRLRSIDQHVSYSCSFLLLVTPGTAPAPASAPGSLENPGRSCVLSKLRSKDGANQRKLSCGMCFVQVLDIVCFFNIGGFNIDMCGWFAKHTKKPLSQLNLHHLYLNIFTFLLSTRISPV